MQVFKIGDVSYCVEMTRGLLTKAKTHTQAINSMFERLSSIDK